MAKLISGIYNQGAHTVFARPIGEPLPRDLFKKRLKEKPILNRMGDCWELYCEFQDRHIPKKAGFSWSDKQRVWWTDNPKKAVQLIRFATKPTKKHLLSLFAE